jgi:outer membrane protein OmpA-like peptidoglycan-associated protein
MSDPDRSEIHMHGRFLLSPLASLALLAGCDNGQKMNEQALLDENRDLRAELDRSRGAVDDAEARARQLQFQLDEANAQLAEAKSQPPLPADSEGFTWRQDEGRAVVEIEGDVLFDSGKFDLKPAAQSTLRAIARQIKDSYPGSEIRVDGFTDTDQIRANRRNVIPTNYHLGFFRAYAVGQFLQRQGIDKGAISYGSYGPEKPQATKAESRRVEVSVIQ